MSQTLDSRPASPGNPHFRERPTARIVPDAWIPAAAAALLATLAAWAGWTWPALIIGGLAVFFLAFFRNPQRTIPGDPKDVIAPADGRIIEVSETVDENGTPGLRIGIFLSVFNVHVNRVPLSGRVESIQRAGTRKRPAFDRRALTDNVRCAMTLTTDTGVRFQVVQITGLIARRIVCHPQVGEWLERGQRYGLIRFGSRTDVVLPTEAEPLVTPGRRVRGGSTILAKMPAQDS